MNTLKTCTEFATTQYATYLAKTKPRYKEQNLNLHQAIISAFPDHCKFSLLTDAFNFTPEDLDMLNLKLKGHHNKKDTRTKATTEFWHRARTVSSLFTFTINTWYKPTKSQTKKNPKPTKTTLNST